MQMNRTIKNIEKERPRENEAPHFAPREMNLPSIHNLKSQLVRHDLNFRTLHDGR